MKKGSLTISVTRESDSAHITPSPREEPSACSRTAPRLSPPTRGRPDAAALAPEVEGHSPSVLEAASAAALPKAPLFVRYQQNASFECGRGHVSESPSRCTARTGGHARARCAAYSQTRPVENDASCCLGAVLREASSHQFGSPSPPRPRGRVGADGGSWPGFSACSCKPASPARGCLDATWHTMKK